MRTFLLLAFLLMAGVILYQNSVIQQQRKEVQSSLDLARSALHHCWTVQ